MNLSETERATISHYRLLELLGRGGMGEVWRAEDMQLPRTVAVKLLPAHLAADREAAERLLREARAAASVDHPGVVAVYEAGFFGDRAARWPTSPTTAGSITTRRASTRAWGVPKRPFAS